MEHVNATASLRQHQQQSQQQSHHHNQQQQQQHDNQQQFCLRWHNHQTSLLSTLPILLDQSHLTDVTLSAEGRTLRAHRVVLSACSTFFLELFRALDTTNHPVIIIPGASFAAIVALLTFMYSGEVNVFEEQIPTLLNLAETLGIKGLADVQNNKSAKRQTDYAEQLRKTEVDTPPTPTTPPDFVSQPQHDGASTLLPPPQPNAAAAPTLTTPTSCNKIPTPLESLFIKSLQFYPNLLPQPLNFSQSALNKTSELIAKYQQHCNLYQSALGNIAGKEFLLSPTQMQTEEAVAPNNEETYNAKRLCTAEKKQQQQQQQQPQQQQQHQQQKDIKRIDKIVENLRCSNKTQCGESTLVVTHQQQQQQQQQQQHYQQQQLQLKTSIANFAQSMSPNLTAKPPMFASAASQLQQQQQSPTPHSFMSPEEQMKFQQQLEHFASCSRDVAVANRNTPDSSCIKPESTLLIMPEKLPTPTPSSPQAKTPSNSKLYATCFICHKQLSNQYNLRVHLETHQNVRYACNVCSHVSRSKDALRKHVSYRHPGAPSPCESEARRKRAKTLSIATPSVATSTLIGISPPSPTSAPTTPFQLNNLGTPGNVGSLSDTTETTAPLTTAAINSAAYMFLPNQFHLAAAAAAAVRANSPAQSQQQQQQQIKASTMASNILPVTTTAISSIAITPTMTFTTCAITATTAAATSAAATSAANTKANFVPEDNVTTTASTIKREPRTPTTVGNDLNTAASNINVDAEKNSAESPNTHNPSVTVTAAIGNSGSAMTTS